MKPERGKQADDSLGDLVSRFDEGGVLGSGEIRRGIETAADLFQVPLTSQPQEIRSGNAEFPNATWFPARQFDGADYSWLYLAR